MEEILYKTIYIGFHDGQRAGETPLLKHEPPPLRLIISHCQAAFIVKHLYNELKLMTKGLIEEKTMEDHGSWP